MKKYLFAFLLTLNGLIASAQNYKVLEDLTFLPIKPAVGQIYIALGATPNANKEPYGYLERDKPLNGMTALTPYEMSGKKLKLIKLINDGDNVILQDGEGLKYKTLSISDIRDVFRYDVIEEASKLLLNKTLYFQKNPSVYIYNDTTRNATIYFPREGYKYMPVLITDVQVGDDVDQLRIFFKTEKKQILVYNYRPAKYDNGKLVCEFSNIFYTEDVKAKFDYPEAIWNDIRKGLPETGMTTEQVRLAMGMPNKINDSSGLTQWVYNSVPSHPVYLYFKDGLLYKYEL